MNKFTMKAAAISGLGAPDVLQSVDLDIPVTGPKQVRVKIKTAGVQPFDLAVRKSGYTLPGLSIQFPQILGNDFAGIIDQVGDEAEGFSIGDEVIGWALLSCYAEYVVVGTDQIVLKPNSMPWEEAGAISGSGQTAYTALKELGVVDGDIVLIHAAAGGVGSMAVQLARAWGATVIGTASEHNHDYLRSLGAIPVSYGNGLADRVRALAPSGVDAAFDAAGEASLLASVELVQEKDRIGTIVVAAAELAKTLGVRMIRSKRSTERLAEIVDLYAQGKLKVHIRKTFPLNEAANAHREIESGHGRGKVVLTIDSIL